ncbi:hypothetical protein [Fretibacter rubidus]|uniref:RHS repeat domain-containing protein n=1 Tax=Fretibacter rubidus TaxID=570162 RepID=UPI003529DD14
MRILLLISSLLIFSNAFSQVYIYDMTGRIAEITYPDNQKFKYEYDASGNITQILAVVASRSVVNGTPGNDIIQGSSVSEVMTGGSGKDRFVLPANSGSDVITDFSLTDDVLAFGNDPYLSVRDLKNMMTQFDDYVVLELNTVSRVKIDSVNIDDFRARNFRIAADHPDGPGPFRRASDYRPTWTKK